MLTSQTCAGSSLSETISLLIRTVYRQRLCEMLMAPLWVSVQVGYSIQNSLTRSFSYDS